MPPQALRAVSKKTAATLPQHAVFEHLYRSAQAAADIPCLPLAEQLGRSALVLSRLTAAAVSRREAGRLCAGCGIPITSSTCSSIQVVELSVRSKRRAAVAAADAIGRTGAKAGRRAAPSPAVAPQNVVNVFKKCKVCGHINVQPFASVTAAQQLASDLQAALRPQALLQAAMQPAAKLGQLPRLQQPALDRSVLKPHSQAAQPATAHQAHAPEVKPTTGPNHQAATPVAHANSALEAPLLDQATSGAVLPSRDPRLRAGLRPLPYQAQTLTAAQLPRPQFTPYSPDDQQQQVGGASEPAATRDSLPAVSTGNTTMAAAVLLMLKGDADEGQSPRSTGCDAQTQQGAFDSHAQQPMVDEASDVLVNMGPAQLLPQTRKQAQAKQQRQAHTPTSKPQLAQNHQEAHAPTQHTGQAQLQVNAQTQQAAAQDHPQQATSAGTSKAQSAYAQPQEQGVAELQLPPRPAALALRQPLVGVLRRAMSVSDAGASQQLADADMVLSASPRVVAVDTGGLVVSQQVAQGQQQVAQVSAGQGQLQKQGLQAGQAQQQQGQPAATGDAGVAVGAAQVQGVAAESGGKGQDAAAADDDDDDLHLEVLIRKQAGRTTNRQLNDDGGTLLDVQPVSSGRSQGSSRGKRHLEEGCVATEMDVQPGPTPSLAPSSGQPSAPATPIGPVDKQLVQGVAQGTGRATRTATAAGLAAAAGLGRDAVETGGGAAEVANGRKKRQKVAAVRDAGGSTAGVQGGTASKPIGSTAAAVAASVAVPATAAGGTTGRRTRSGVGKSSAGKGGAGAGGGSGGAADGQHAEGQTGSQAGGGEGGVGGSSQHVVTMIDIEPDTGLAASEHPIDADGVVYLGDLHAVGMADLRPGFRAGSFAYSHHPWWRRLRLRWDAVRGTREAQGLDAE